MTAYHVAVVWFDNGVAVEDGSTSLPAMSNLITCTSFVNCSYIHSFLCMFLEGGFSQSGTHTALAGC